MASLGIYLFPNFVLANRLSLVNRPQNFRFLTNDKRQEMVRQSLPYFQFDAVIPEAGEFHFTWYDDDGSVYETKKKVEMA